MSKDKDWFSEYSWFQYPSQDELQNATQENSSIKANKKPFNQKEELEKRRTTSNKLGFKTVKQPPIAEKSKKKVNEIKFDDPNRKVTFEEPSEHGQSETKASTKRPREMPPEEDEFAGQIEKTMVDIEEL